MDIIINLKHLVAICRRITPMSDERAYLRGIMLEQHGADLLAIATDGYRMVAARINRNCPDGFLDEYVNQKVVIPGELLMSLKFPRGHNGIGELVLNGRNVTLKVGDTTSTSLLIEAKLPNWRRNFPDPEYETTPGHYNPDFIMDFHKLNKTLAGCKNVFVNIAQNGSQHALVAFHKDADCVGIIMPMRDIGNTTCKTFPGWFHDPR